MAERTSFRMCSSIIAVLSLAMTIVSTTYSRAEVYSTVQKVEQLEGYEDCFKVTYKIWEDHNNTNPADDTLIGTYSAVVGDDCIPPGIEIPGSSGEAMPLSIPTELSFSTSPNPARGLLTIRLENMPGDFHAIQWTIVNGLNRIVDSGRVWLQGEPYFTIQTEGLEPGAYYLRLTDGRHKVGSRLITIIR